MKDKPIILVLDYESKAAAETILSRIDPSLCRVKVGKQLFTAEGPQLVDDLQRRGFDVFLDLKYHDIPNTVAAACKVAARQGVWMLNVHASGGKAMMAAAREAVDQSSHQPIMIAVTVLTSMGEEDVREIGYASDVASSVTRLAGLAHAAGFDGVVCSAQEAPQMKASFGTAFQCVTPGIRLAGDAKGDQTRVVTPLDAARMGADYLVIGRSVTAAKDPVATLRAIHESLLASPQLNPNS